MARAAVVIKDGSGTIIGTSSLGAGTVISDAGGPACRMSFESEVPNTDFYSIAVAGRAPTTFSMSEMASSNWMPVLQCC